MNDRTCSGFGMDPEAPASELAKAAIRKGLSGAGDRTIMIVFLGEDAPAPIRVEAGAGAAWADLMAVARDALTRKLEKAGG